MRRILSFILLVTLCSREVQADERPNIVLMLSDDQGWDGLSVPMHPDVPASKGQHFYTPNLERLAARGMRFSNAYSPAPVCSPTRISLQTGKSPAQLHWT
ncbi:MAG: sulfatase-like hydrolase/transferase, partial [Planctomycetota bacterium]